MASMYARVETTDGVFAAVVADVQDAEDLPRHFAQRSAPQPAVCAEEMLQQM